MRTPPLPHRALLFLAALALAGACDDGGNDEPLPEECAAVDCGAHGQCQLDVERMPVCACDTGYTGADCADCAPGFAAQDDGRCSELTIDCSVDPLVCGSGFCVPGPGGSDTCQCPPDRTGRTCAECAPGYQDHDGDGFCAESCAQRDCSAPQFCDDASGQAVCRCPEGRTGSDCDACDAGYRAVELDGGGLDCRATCDALACGAAGQCSDLGAAATCVCGLGYAGERCERCVDPTLDPDADQCRVAMPAAPTLLALRHADSREDLAFVALDPTHGTATPVALPTDAVPPYLESAVYDPARGLLYAIDNSEILSIDLAGGVVRTLATLDGFGARGPTFDPETGTVYIADAFDNGIYLRAIDPASGAVSTVGALPRRGAQAIVYDAAARRLVVVSGEHVDAVDPVTGLATELARMALPDPRYGQVWPAAIVGGSLVAAVPSGTLGHWASTRCQAALRALGRDPRAYGAPSIVVLERGELAGAQPLVVSAGDESAAAPLLVFATDGGSDGTGLEPVEVELHASHPDAVGCVVAARRPVALRIPAQTRLAHLIVVLDDGASGSSLTVEPGFVLPGPGHAPLVVAQQSASLTLDVPEGFDSTLAMHHELGFETTYPAASSVADTLLRIDLASGALHFQPIAPLGTLGGLTWIP